MRAYPQGVNIVLIGYRDSGKTAVGRELARRLRWPLVDTDALIEQRAGWACRYCSAMTRRHPKMRTAAAVYCQRES